VMWSRLSSAVATVETITAYKRKAHFTYFWCERTRENMESLCHKFSKVAVTKWREAFSWPCFIRQPNKSVHLSSRNALSLKLCVEGFVANVQKLCEVFNIKTPISVTQIRKTISQKLAKPAYTFDIAHSPHSS